MRIFKRMAALGLSGCLMLSLAACGSRPAENDLGSAASESAVTIAEPEQSNTEIQIRKGQLCEMENIIGALLAYMYDNDLRKLDLDTVDSDVAEHYLVNYINRMSDRDTMPYSTVLGQTEKNFYREDREDIEDIMLTGLGVDSTEELEGSDAIYFVDDACYVEESAITDAEVRCVGSVSKTTLTEQKQFTYRYSLVDAEKTVQTGRLKISFVPNTQAKNGISVRKIVIRDAQNEEKPATEQEEESEDRKPSAEEEDGEAREEVSISASRSEVESKFGSEYDYVLDGIEDIGSKRYYVYKQTQKIEEEDAQAHKKALQYIFVALDGSVIYTGTADDDGYYIDYSS